MGGQWPAGEPSITSLQLLINLRTIRDNLTTLGQDRIVAFVDRYLAHFNKGQLSSWDIVDYATACISRVYHLTVEQDRIYVFKDYRPAKALFPGYVYAPKAEVHHFCERIEPQILACQRLAEHPVEADTSSLEDSNS